MVTARLLPALLATLLAFGAALPAPAQSPGTAYAFPLPPTGKLVEDASRAARNVTDGDRNTYWGSAPGFPAWITVDLGAAHRVDHIAVDWERVTYSTDYRVEVSPDGLNWHRVLHVAGWSGHTHDLRAFKPVTARWVRLYGERGPNYWGMWLSEFGVYGPEAPKRDLALGGTVVASGTIARGFTAAEFEQVENAMKLGDRRYHARDFQGALALYRSVYDPFGLRLRAQKDRMWEALRLRVLAADFRVRRPDARPQRPRRLVMLVVPETDLVLPGPPEAPTPFRTHRMLDESQLPLTREGLFFFGESFMALTDGRVGWEVTEERLNGYAVRRLTRAEYGKNGNKFLAQLETDGIDPDPRPVFNRHPEADMFYMFWPGTHPGLQRNVTNGGSGTVWVQTWLGKTSRACLLSEGDACEPYEFYNTLGWFHHEFFHQVEFGYPTLDFPKNPMHAWMERSRWPADFVGSGEWDYYENVYRQRVLPFDGLDRMSWATGRYPRGIWASPAPSVPVTTGRP